MGNANSSSMSSDAGKEMTASFTPPDVEESKVTTPTKQSSRVNSEEPPFHSPVWKKLLDHVSSQETKSMSELIEILFRIEERGSTVATEIRGGFVHFMSVSIILGVNPMQLESAGYGKQAVAAATALASGCACIFTGLICNFPFLATPTLATGIYLSSYMENTNLSCVEGNTATVAFGFLLVFCSIRAVTDFLAFLIPFPLKKGVVIGLALLITLRALIQLRLIVPNTGDGLALGNVNDPSIIIAVTTIVLIGVGIHFELKGAYVIGLATASLVYWVLVGPWPTSFISISPVVFEVDFSTLSNPNVAYCVMDLFLICNILLSGLSNGLVDLAGIARQDGSAPRRRWIYFVCGLGSMLSGSMGGGPVILTAESAPGIVDGARSGLSSCVCGVLFLISYVCIPVWTSIPICANAPVIVMIGFLLFENTAQIDWRDVKQALPVYITTIFCAFSYSILYGVLFGIFMFVALHVLTSDVKETKDFFLKVCSYCNPWRNDASRIGSSLFSTVPSTYDNLNSTNEVVFDLSEDDMKNVGVVAGYSSFDSMKKIQESISADDLGIEKSIIANSVLKYNRKDSFVGNSSNSNNENNTSSGGGRTTSTSTKSNRTASIKTSSIKSNRGT